MRTLLRTKLVLGLAAWLMAAGLAMAQQDDDLLRDFNERLKIAAQALEADVDAALADANKNLAGSAPLLKKTLARLEEDKALSPARRASLIATVRERLKKAEEADARATVSAVRQRQGINSRDNPPRLDPGREEETIRRGIDAIRALRQQGKMGEAANLANDLARRFPDNTQLQLLRQQTDVNERLREAGIAAADKARGEAGALRQVDKSSTPIAGDVEYSKDFLERTKNRKSADTINFTKKEQEILKALNQVTLAAIDLKGLSLDQAVEYLRKNMGVPFTVNKSALDDLNLTYETPVTASVPKGVSKRSALRMILGNLGLTYVVKNESIEITSVQRAKTEVVVRYYQVGALLGLGGGAASGAAEGLNQQQQIDRLIDLIQSTVDPDSWEKNGGPGRIVYHAPTGTLIIKNTAEVHQLLGGGTTR